MSRSSNQYFQPVHICPVNPTLTSEEISKVGSTRPREQSVVQSFHTMLRFPQNPKSTISSSVIRPGLSHPRHRPSWWLGFGTSSCLFSLFFSSHDNALAAGGRLIRILRLFDLCDEQLKSLVDVLVVAGAGLGPAAVVLFGKLLAVVGRDLALLGAQIALVAHDDDGDPLDALWRRMEGLMSVPRHIERHCQSGGNNSRKDEQGRQGRVF